MAEGHGSKEHLQEAAIAALLTSASIAKAAAKAGVDESTLDRWLKETGFQRDYRAARRQVVEHSLSTLQRGMVAAVTTLLKLLQCEEPSTQCRAAGLILQHGIGALNLWDIESRIARLEEAAAGLTTEPTEESP